MERVKVKKIEIINFKGIEHLELDFTYLDSDRILDNIVFYGINGSGKSTVLEAIYVSLVTSTFYHNQINKSNIEKFLIEFLSFSDEWIYNNKDEFIINIQIDENSNLIDGTLRYNRENYLSWSTNNKFSTNFNNPTVYLSSYRILNPSMISFAGDWKQIQNLREKSFLDKREKYLQKESSFPTLNLQFTNNYATVKQYLVNLITDKKVGTLSYENSKILEKVQESFKIFFPNKLFLEQLSREGDMQDYRLMIRNEDTTIVDLDQLSSGEREIIAFFTYLCTEALNKSILIIDEPELHLHDKWQSLIPYAIRKLFPNVQLFMATHSEEIHQSFSESELFGLVK